MQRYDGAPEKEIRNAPRQALVNLVNLAIEEEVCCVVIAGDIYDGDWQDYNTGCFFIQQMVRLHEVNIPVFVISGNHDAANKMTRSLRLPSNVTYFPASHPDTIILDDPGVALHGQSFPTQSVSEDLSLQYPEPVPHCFNIGILHTCATGGDGHANYAPCTVEGLKLKNYHYWALGHIHKRETLSTDPFIGFSGNIQGRHIRETGPKGCLLVSVNDQNQVESQFRPLDVMRWELIRVDVSEQVNGHEVVDQVISEIRKAYQSADGRLLAVRVELYGRTSIHEVLHSDRVQWLNEIKAQVFHVSLSEIWIENLKVRTESVAPDTEIDHIPTSALEELNALFDQITRSPDHVSEIGFQFDDVLNKLPLELKKNTSEDQPGRIQDAIIQAKAILMNQFQNTTQD